MTLSLEVSYLIKQVVTDFCCLDLNSIPQEQASEESCSIGKGNSKFQLFSLALWLTCRDVIYISAANITKNLYEAHSSSPL